MRALEDCIQRLVWFINTASTADNIYILVPGCQVIVPVDIDQFITQMREQLLDMILGYDITNLCLCYYWDSGSIYIEQDNIDINKTFIDFRESEQ